MGAVQSRDFIVCVRCFSANPVRINTSSVIELTLSGSLPWTYGSGETGRLTLWGALVSQTNFALSTQNGPKRPFSAVWFARPACDQTAESV